MRLDILHVRDCPNASVLETRLAPRLATPIPVRATRAHAGSPTAALVR